MLRLATWVRLISTFILIGLLGWCTTNNYRNRHLQPVRTELATLFLEEGVPMARGESITEVVKHTGSDTMERVFYDGASKCTLPALKWLVDNGVNPKSVGKLKGLMLLQQAARHPEFENMEYFLGLGLDPLERSRDGRTVLHVAAEGGLEQRTLTLLLSKGLKVNDVDDLGRTPIHYATVKSVAPLAAAGADVDAKDNRGVTALDLAAATSHADVVNELLNHSASVFTTDAKGRTPLHYAALNPNGDVVDALRAHGAPTAARDSDGFTPREVAAAQVGDNPRSLSAAIVDKF
jgi:ankyrin repeat protein